MSGPGSTLEYTANLRAKLPNLLSRYGVKTFLDAPCGDFHWMKEVDLEGIQYIGVEIVETIVTDLQGRYHHAGRTFLAGDITTMKLPACDLMLCRDCLFHLPYADAWRFLRNFCETGPELLLLTSHMVYHNRDIERAGRWRQVNMRRPPFNLPEPIEQIEDWIESRPKRYVGLWNRTQIAACVGRNYHEASPQAVNKAWNPNK